MADKIMELGIYLPVGEYKPYGAYRKDRIEGWLPGPVAVTWNITKKN
jgi:peptide/nickel transport system substrate-binding protein